MKSIVVAAAALAACSAQVAPGAPAPEATALGVAQTGLEVVQLTITSANAIHRFKVEVAATPEQQQHGMMFRTALAPDRGMIFPLEEVRFASFWMHNTLIPLDIIFIRADGTIARIATAKPLDDTGVPSGEPVAAVLEIAGGRAAELGIAPGDKVVWG